MQCGLSLSCHGDGSGEVGGGCAEEGGSADSQALNTIPNRKMGGMKTTKLTQGGSTQTGWSVKVCVHTCIIARSGISSTWKFLYPRQPQLCWSFLLIKSIPPLPPCQSLAPPWK